MKKTELIKGILKLAEELDKADGFAPVIIIDDMEKLVDKYVEKLSIPRVSNRRELLIDFRNYWYGNRHSANAVTNDEIDDFLGN
tara:strand:- start:318 stop:569 length:252 start_codon:yes stop_codon:yes gene_type:complete